MESLSLIDAVMPDVVATRQNQQNQQKQIVKTEPDAIGDEGTTSILFSFNLKIIVHLNHLILFFKSHQISLRIWMLMVA